MPVPFGHRGKINNLVPEHIILDVINTTASFECISLSFHPFGVALTVGSTEGHLIIMNSETGVLVNSIRNNILCSTKLL
ncbi:hypothetical protein NQ318_017991 [Aromia moschata]|uniref:Uncharacterized protein n=1 Tax=Aromia moschata TaxID=1265417 RepID=A0AAV8YB70_9CUCU|nr:hypothetical protein NQ318_017991 [Aromia moschata]